MITIEKAFELAQKANVTGISLSRTADETADYWCFYYDTDDVLIGPRPVAVNKNDGKVWSVFIRNMRMSLIALRKSKCRELSSLYSIPHIWKCVEEMLK